MTTKVSEIAHVRMIEPAARMSSKSQRRTEMVRTLVLKTNPYFPFRVINRWPYTVALRAVCRAVAKHPEVRSLYLRHGLAAGVWTPGLSDIDLSVILKSGLDPGSDFRVVHAIRTRYRSLKKWFPMLGELEILEEDDLLPWLRATSETPQPRNWTLLHGTPAVDLALDRWSGWRERALGVALWIYLDLLPPCLAQPESDLRTADTLRRLRKILRLLRAVPGGSSGPAPALTAESGVCEVATELERVARTIGDEQPPSRAFEKCTIVLPDKLLVVLPDGARAHQIAAEVAADDSGLPVMPLSLSVFRYLVRRYDPYIYDFLATNRGIVHGDDPLAHVPPPGHAEFSDYIERDLPRLLAFTRGPEIFENGQLDWAEFKSEWRRLMALRLLIDKNLIASRRSEIDTHWRREYPQLAVDFDALRAGSRQAAFALFRMHASQVRDSAAAVRS